MGIPFIGFICCFLLLYYSAGDLEGLRKSIITPMLRSINNPCMLSECPLLKTWIRSLIQRVMSQIEL